MLPDILAEAAASPTPESLKAWLEVFLYICGIIAAGSVAWAHLTNRASKTEIDGQPLEVKAHAGVVNREELRQVHGRIDRERREIDAAIALVAIQAEKRADKMDGKLDENTKLTSEMNGQLQQMNQTLSQVQESLAHFMRDQAHHR